jgi:hypothetical protein
MTDYTIEFEAEIEMTGEHPHPPILTPRVRPNLFVAGKFFPCAVTKTHPEAGVAAQDKGSIIATALCPAEDLDRFVSGASFELRDGPLHGFAKGRFRDIRSSEEYRPKLG